MSNINPLALELMNIGKDILDIHAVTTNSFELKPPIDFEVLYIGENNHLVILQNADVRKVAFYNFYIDKEPMVIFDANECPSHKGFNFDYWNQLARIARAKYDKFCKANSHGYKTWRAEQDAKIQKELTEHLDQGVARTKKLIDGLVENPGYVTRDPLVPKDK